MWGQRPTSGDIWGSQRSFKTLQATVQGGGLGREERIHLERALEEVWVPFSGQPEK